MSSCVPLMVSKMIVNHVTRSFRSSHVSIMINAHRLNRTTGKTDSKMRVLLCGKTHRMIFGYLPTNHFLVPLCQWFVSCIGRTSSMLMCLHQPGAHRHEAMDLRMCPRDMNEFGVGVTWPPGGAAEDMVCWFYLLLHISSLHCRGDKAGSMLQTGPLGTHGQSLWPCPFFWL